MRAAGAPDNRSGSDFFRVRGVGAQFGVHGAHRKKVEASLSYDGRTSLKPRSSTSVFKVRGSDLTCGAGLKREDAEIAIAGDRLRAAADRIDVEYLKPLQIAGLSELNDAGELVAKSLMGRRAEIGRLWQLAFLGRSLYCCALVGVLRRGGAFRAVCRRLSRGIGGELCIA